MASLISKTVKGRQYWYLVESRRINGKVKQVVLEYIGNQKKLSDYLINCRKGMSLSDASHLCIKSYQKGDAYALYQMAKSLGVENILDTFLGKRVCNGVLRSTSLVLAAIHRASSPGSKNDFHKWMTKTSLPYELDIPAEAMTSQHFWEQMDGVTVDMLQRAEDALTHTLMERYPFGLEKIALDYTNYFTYIASGNDRSTLAKRGKNKQKRNDLKQCSLAIVTSKDSGFPLFSHIYEGNHNDQTEFSSYMEQLKKRIPDYRAQDITVVFDGGSCTKKNMELLDTHYICAFSLTSCKELYEIDISAYQSIQISEKEVLVYRTTKKIWGKDRECVLTFSQALYDGQVRELDVHIEKAQAAVTEMDKQWKNPRSRLRKTDGAYERKAKKILSQKYMSEIITIERTGEGITCRINEARKEGLMHKYFGKKLIMTDHREWTTEDIVRTYREQDSIEKIFRSTKDHEHFNMRPIYHWTDQKIRVHIFICLLGLTLTIALQKEVSAGGVQLTKEKILEELSGIRESWVYEDNVEKPRGKVIRKLEEMGDCQKKIWEIVKTL